MRLKKATLISSSIAFLQISNVLSIPRPDSWQVEACKPDKLKEQDRYTCTDGRIQCNSGWIGDLCQVAACETSCHPQHGYCTKPGECKCNLGYTGEGCRECMKLPGCANGYCNRSFECKCEDGWQGMFCNSPICTACDPTRGTCTEPDVCTCKKGYKGEGCLECDTPEGCKNGFCTQPGECRCEEGWTGPLCDIPECAPGCNGICSVPGECKCEIGWTGELCDVCTVYPGCANGVCTQPWQCQCLDGWGGELCETPLWSQGYRGGVCLPIGSFLCMNGGTELCNYWGNGTLVEKPRCLCPKEYTGEFCEYKIYVPEPTTEETEMDTTSILSTSVEESQTIQIQTEYQNIRLPLEDRENIGNETTKNEGVRENVGKKTAEKEGVTYVPLGTEMSSMNTMKSVLSTERIPSNEVTVLNIRSQTDNSWTPIFEEQAKTIPESLFLQNTPEFWDPDETKFIGSGRRTS